MVLRMRDLNSLGGAPDGVLSPGVECEGTSDAYKQLAYSTALLYERMDAEAAATSKLVYSRGVERLHVVVIFTCSFPTATTSSRLHRSERAE